MGATGYDGEGLNLVIFTKNGVYNCLSIQGGARAATLINEIVAEKKDQKEAMSKEEKPATTQEKRFCHRCGRETQEKFFIYK